MLTLKYFASLREQLDLDEERIDCPTGIGTLAELIAYLSRRGQAWHRLLTTTPVLAAVNQEICGLQQTIEDGDEIAFFPPVTGG